MRSVRSEIKRTARSERGDSLIEVVVSFLLIMLALTAVTTMVLTAGRLNERAYNASQELQKAIEDIEASPRSGGAGGDMIIEFTDSTSISIPVKTETLGGTGIEFFYPE